MKNETPSSDSQNNNDKKNKRNLFLIGIYSMEDGNATTRHEVTRKRSTKRLKHTGNLFTRNLQLIGVC